MHSSSLLRVLYYSLELSALRVQRYSKLDQVVILFEENLQASAKLPLSGTVASYFDGVV